MFLLRMRLATATIAFLLNSITQAQSLKEEQFTFPAEFEKQDAVWMGWRTVTSRGIDKSETLLRIIKSLTPYIKVNLFIDHDSTSSMSQKEFIKEGISGKKVKMFVL